MPTYPPVFWRFVLCNKNGKPISMLDGIASDVRFDYILNRAAVMSFSVPSEDPRVNILHTDGDPYLDVGDRVMKAWRKTPIGSTETPGGWELKFAGRVWSLEDTGDGDTVRTSVVCFDPLKILEKRVCRNDDGTYWDDQKPVEFWNGAVYPAVIGRPEDGSSGAKIIKKLIQRTRDYAGPVHINLSGNWEDTSGMTLSFDQAMVSDAIATITDTITCDLEVTDGGGSPGYLNAYDGTFMRLGGVARLGSDKTATVFFYYAKTPFTASEYTRTKSLDMMANAIHFMGKSRAGWRVSAEDATSQDDFLVMEDVASLTGIEHSAIAQKLADIQLALRKDPRDIVTVLPTPESSSMPWNDYWLGDTVSVEAATTPFPVTRQTVSGAQRIYGISLAIDDDYGEHVTDLITTPTD